MDTCTSIGNLAVSILPSLGIHLVRHTHTDTQPFYGPFSGTTRVSWCQKKFSSGLYGAKGD